MENKMETTIYWIYIGGKTGMQDLGLSSRE